MLRPNRDLVAFLSRVPEQSQQKWRELPNNRRLAAIAGAAAVSVLIAGSAGIAFFQGDDPGGPQLNSVAEAAPVGQPAPKAAAQSAQLASMGGPSTPGAAAVTPGSQADAAVGGNAGQRVAKALAGGVAPQTVRLQSVSADGGVRPAGATPPETAIDSGRTAALPASASAPRVEVATTEAQVRALEEQMWGPTRTTDPKVTNAVASADQDTAAATPSQQAAGGDGELQPATVTKYVNLHAGPDNGAKVLKVVPANAQIRASTTCRQWCTVEYQGEHGYIYKDFVHHQSG